MGSVLAIISKDAFGKLRTYDGGTPAVGAKVNIKRYDSTHPTLDKLKNRGALYLVTVRPKDTLWLAAVLGAPSRSGGGWRSQGNNAPVVDLTPLCAELGLARGDGKLAMRLQTPRELDQRAEAILTFVETAADLAFVRHKPYVAKVPKWILKQPAISAPKAAPKPKMVAGGKLPPLAGPLGPACLAQIDEVLDELREQPERFLIRKASAKRGPFTATVPSIFAGAINAAEATRMLGAELAPFVDEATKKAIKKAKGDLDDYFGELVDTVAIRAIDALCTGMVAWAIDRERAVPEVCAWYRDPLQRYAEHVRGLLGIAPPTKTKTKTKAKPKNPLAKGAFAFVNSRNLNGDDVLAESAIDQAQFIEAMYMYAGHRGMTAAESLDTYLESHGLTRREFHIQLWDVMEGGRSRPRFEYWVQGAGDGMIFDRGTDRSPNSIGSTQHAFECHGIEDDESAALVDALQAAADRTRGL